jgi:hypothetical protein
MCVRKKLKISYILERRGVSRINHFLRIYVLKLYIEDSTRPCVLATTIADSLVISTKSVLCACSRGHLHFFRPTHLQGVRPKRIPSPGLLSMPPWRQMVHSPCASPSWHVLHWDSLHHAVGTGIIDTVEWTPLHHFLPPSNSWSKNDVLKR